MLPSNPGTRPHSTALLLVCAFGALTALSALAACGDEDDSPGTGGAGGSGQSGSGGSGAGGGTGGGAGQGAAGSAGQGAHVNPSSADSRGVWVSMRGEFFGTRGSGLHRVNPDTYALEAWFDSAAVPAAGVDSLPVPAESVVGCGGALWVGHFTEEYYSRIDLIENRVSDTVPISTTAFRSACAGGAVWAYGLGNGDGEGYLFTRLDPATKAETAAFPIMVAPSALVAHGGSLWTGTIVGIAERDLTTGAETGKTVSLVDIQVPGEASTRTMATLGLVSDGPSLWAVGTADDENSNPEAFIVRIDTAAAAQAEVVKVSSEGVSDIGILLGEAPPVAAAAGKIWVLNSAAATVTVFDAQTGAQLGQATTGAGPAGIALGFGRAWVANGDGSLTVVDQATFGVVQTVALPRGVEPRGVAITGEGG
ncbi:MAG TPA: hypothetical protein VFS43_43130 [Polyangiaceae bacterium]|nr:hypothetical protein [Polyangiaceae bacterium]